MLWGRGPLPSRSNFDLISSSHRQDEHRTHGAISALTLLLEASGHIRKEQQTRLPPPRYATRTLASLQEQCSEADAWFVDPDSCEVETFSNGRVHGASFYHEGRVHGASHYADTFFATGQQHELRRTSALSLTTSEEPQEQLEAQDQLSALTASPMRSLMKGHTIGGRSMGIACRASCSSADQIDDDHLIVGGGCGHGDADDDRTGPLDAKFSSSADSFGTGNLAHACSWGPTESTHVLGGGLSGSLKAFMVLDLDAGSDRCSSPLS